MQNSPKQFQSTREGDSSSLLLFIITVDDIIKTVNNMSGYRQSTSGFTIICYTDNVVLVTGSEDHTQRFVFEFNKSQKSFSMNIL